MLMIDGDDDDDDDDDNGGSDLPNHSRITTNIRLPQILHKKERSVGCLESLHGLDCALCTSRANDSAQYLFEHHKSRPVLLSVDGKLHRPLESWGRVGEVEQKRSVVSDPGGTALSGSASWDWRRKWRRNRVGCGHHNRLQRELKRTAENYCKWMRRGAASARQGLAHFDCYSHGVTCAAIIFLDTLGNRGLKIGILNHGILLGNDPDQPPKRPQY